MSVAFLGRCGKQPTTKQNFNMAKILVVDDEPCIRELIRHVLRGSGHEVADASNPDEAMDFCRASRTDLVITDMIMPGHDGPGAIKRFHAEFPEMKIMAMSGEFVDSPADSQYQASRIGVDRTIAKPFNITEMANAVNELVA